MQFLCTMSRMFGLLLLSAWASQAAGALETASAPLTYYVQLIRGTDQEYQEATWKPVGPKLSSRLSPIFRWKNYWQVNCQSVSVKKGKPTRHRLSDVREVEIELVNPSEIEIRLYLKA